MNQVLSHTLLPKNILNFMFIFKIVILAMGLILFGVYFNKMKQSKRNGILYLLGAILSIGSSIYLLLSDDTYNYRRPMFIDDEKIIAQTKFYPGCIEADILKPKLIAARKKICEN